MSKKPLTPPKPGDILTGRVVELVPAGEGHFHRIIEVDDWGLPVFYAASEDRALSDKETMALGMHVRVTLKNETVGGIPAVGPAS